MASDESIVIVGASLAGARAAETLREEGFAGRITLIGEEHERPYQRPPLSKGYLAGREDKSSIYVHEEDWYERNGVELVLGTRATAIDRAAREVELSDGRRIRYDKLLLATGASPRRLDLPGAELEGVYYLRTVEDSERIRNAIFGGGRFVIVGAGWIGLEVAAAACGYGAEVTIVEPQPTPLHGVLGPELGEVFAKLHRGNGVDLRLGESVTQLHSEGGKVTGVVTSSGDTLSAGAVIVGIGARPNTELAEAAGLPVDNGVVVDECLRTEDERIWAAGDVANYHNVVFGRRLRVEHWANAYDGGPAAARSMLRPGTVYDVVPFFYSDQYDLGMEYTGYAPAGTYDRIVYRGDVAGLEFIAFWLKDGRVRAGMNVNVWDVAEDIQKLIRSGRQFDPDRLADPDVPLADLA
ncbi:FAD-dependent oxidoreductase [Carbonactinospora thermoautotrophica]|uniref:DnaG n=1 Tax=Carbonactinospora thermoautotrophica TaxID=1469144 RepID=A0A132MQV2_9ACTN|nr:FAD-dependent oxidoreductase [Carbonactinospora thermoautotrophica]KWX00126.1 pyridine nucleotide-disulfide oxidoreductase [Carbonactinospora thermoautotrophica]KWX01909.1 DnaG [Carbonactinospora thermoautotrophica]KWX06614.1 pyridine nucleotide-disulfide oxidoreductase [Carbonactinospora thermoautotrophica]MCX9189849.1 FAD-dependent oxidoreductase [Carbonactinospora thermoautotrophica]